MAMTAPAGALVDHTRRKRLYVVVPGLCTLAASGIILLSQSFWVVAASQICTAIAGAAIGPAVAGITLGMVRQAGFVRQNGRNQAFNHAGNTVGAALSGLLGWKLGMAAVFWLAAAFGALSILSVMFIPRGAIDDAAARGLEREDGGSVPSEVSGLRTLLDNKPLLVLAAALAAFHLGNGALLPMYGLALVNAKQGDPAGLVAMTIVVAQGTMILASVAATALATRRGYWLVLFISFLALPIRGLLAASFVRYGGVYPVQILDGVGAGLQSVAVPGLVAHLLRGSGRVNLGQGAVMTVQGVGASLSPFIGGWVAQAWGYPKAFLLLASFALISVALWIGFAHQSRREAEARA